MASSLYCRKSGLFTELGRAGVDRELLLVWSCWWGCRGVVNLVSIFIILYTESLRSLHCWLAILVVGVVREVPSYSTVWAPVVLGQQTLQDIGRLIVVLQICLGRV